MHPIIFLLLSTNKGFRLFFFWFHIFTLSLGIRTEELCILQHDYPDQLKKILNSILSPRPENRSLKLCMKYIREDMFADFIHRLVIDGNSNWSGVKLKLKKYLDVSIRENVVTIFQGSTKRFHVSTNRLQTSYYLTAIES